MLLTALFSLSGEGIGLAQSNKTVEDINKVKCDTCYIYAETTMKSVDEAFVGAKSILEVKVGDWVKAQGIKGVDICIAKAKEHLFEIQTRRGDYYRAFVYVNKKEIMPVDNKNEIVILDVKKQKTSKNTSNAIISEDDRVGIKPTVELTPDEKICSDCIIQTLIRKLDDYPKSNLKVLNDQSVFSIQGKNNIIPLSFTECFKKLSHNKRSEFRQKIANRKKALVQEVSQKCMICKSLLQKVDNNVITIEIDQSYNYYQHLFPEINYCTKDHFVCENCYKKWIKKKKKNAFNDSIVLKCSLCKVEHKCSNKTNNVCIII